MSAREEAALELIERVRARPSRFRDPQITMAHGAGGKATLQIDRQNLKGKNAQERQAIVDAKAKERGDIQCRIQKLQSEREKFVAEKQKAAAASAPGGDTLDKAIIESASKQAAAQGMALE